MYISLKLGYNFSSYCYNVSLLIFRSPLPGGSLTLSIYLPSSNLIPPFVDCPSHHLSACPIKHLPKLLVSCGSQGNTVHGSSPHKCSQEVWWDALNVMAAIIPSIMSGLTSFLKLFLYSMTSSGNVPLMWPYCPRV